MPCSRRFLLSAIAVLGLAPMASIEASEPRTSGKYWVFIGTYTSKDGSRGIYRSEFDASSGTLGEPVLAAELENPSFLAINPNGTALYAVGETAGSGPKKNEGTLTSFAIDRKTGALSKLNQMTTGGGGPCYVSVNRSGKFVMVANYGGGSSAMFSVKDDGGLDKLVDFRQHEGQSVNKERQQEPHAHCAIFNASSDGEYAYVVDLGLDKVFSYKLDPVKGTLSPTNPAFLKLPDGSGPRHMAFNPKSGKAYVCGEINSTLMTLRRYGTGGLLEMYDGNNGMEKRADAILSTLEKPVPGNSTAEVLVHPDMGHVVVSNRGDDSLAIFAVNADSTKASGHLRSTGDRLIRTPRNFNIDPTGRWILVGSENGGSVLVAEWGDGNPKWTGASAKVSKPVCIKFLEMP